MEQWKDVVGYEGFYQVSDLGMVRSIDRVVRYSRGGPKRLKGKILQPIYSSNRMGYPTVGLSKEGYTTPKYVHRLVLEAFVGSCPDDFEACHNDGDPTNNLVNNLRWDTRSSNQLDRKLHGTNNARRVRRSDGVEFNSIVEAARETNCHGANITLACQGRHKTSGGYGWEYIE